MKQTEPLRSEEPLDTQGTESPYKRDVLEAQEIYQESLLAATSAVDDVQGVTVSKSLRQAS